MSSGSPPPDIVRVARGNRALRAAILDIVAVVTPILALGTLVLGLGNNAFAAVGGPLAIVLAVAPVFAAPIALILGIVALRRSRELDGRGGSIATIVISAVFILIIVGGGLASVRFPMS